MDNDMFDQNSDNNHFQEFARPVIAGIIGSYIGHKLDQTRFGYWFNTNTTIGIICYWLKILFLLAIISGIILFFYIYLTTPEVG